MKKILIFISFCLASSLSNAQLFSTEEEHIIDSINKLILSSTSHDTTIAQAFVDLSEIYGTSTPDTIKPLCDRTIEIANKALNSSPSKPVKNNLLKSLSKAYNNIGYIYDIHGEMDTALYFYTKSLKIKEEINHKEGIAYSYNNIGFVHYLKGDVDKAIDYYEKSLSIREELNDKSGISSSLSNLGLIHQRQGNIPMALEYFDRSLKICEEEGDKQGEANSLNNLGAIYTSQGDVDLALKYHHKSLQIYDTIGDSYGVVMALNNIGVLHKGLNQYEEALMYLQKGMKLQEEIGDKQGLATTLYNIGGIYEKQLDTTKALEYYLKSIQSDEELGNTAGLAATTNNIGAIYFKQGKIIDAQTYANRSMGLAMELGYPVDIKFAAKLLTDIYEKQNKGMKALEMHKLYITMRDSINNEANLKATAQQQAKYEYEKQKSIDDANHEKQIIIEQEEKEKQRVIAIATAIGLGLVVVFLLFVFNRLRITRKQKLVIEEQKENVELAHHELEEKNQEIMDSITYAKRIQSAILPPKKLVKEYLQESFILYKPKDIVAGDFYWMEHVNVIASEAKQSVNDEQIASGSSNHRNDDSNKQNALSLSKGSRSVILFAAADCTGHGVPGAMVSVVCNNALNRSVREYGLTDPGGILDKTREIVIKEFEKSDEDVKDGMDIALCSLEFLVPSSSLKGDTSITEEKQGTENAEQKTAALLQYAGAHNPLWIIRNGEIIETKANKEPIGRFDKQSPYNTHTFELHSGDTIYIFSDGYIDQFGGEKGKKLKAKALKKLLLSIQSKQMEEQMTLLDNAFEDWRGELEQIDDVCIIGVKI